MRNPLLGCLLDEALDGADVGRIGESYRMLAPLGNEVSADVCGRVYD